MDELKPCIRIQPSSISMKVYELSVWFLNMFHLLTNENTCETKRKKEILILREEKNSEDKND